MNGYKTSKDYKRLKELCDSGYKIVCFTTYDFNENHKGEKDYEEHLITDICRAYKGSDWYFITARGIQYGAYWPDTNRYKSFEEMCEDNNIEFIEPTLLATASNPDRPAYANLVVELKQYLATTPPEQQQRDWEQIKAELPDEGQVPILFNIELARPVTKENDLVIKNGNLEKELESLLKQCGVTAEYVHQDFLRIVASHFTDYGKQEYIKAIKQNHIDTI